jgi:alpha-D-xyloside xylohydrolase
MGQYQQPFLNLKGLDLELAQRNSQVSVPFALSSWGYGFLWNNPAVGRAVFGRNMTTWEAKSTQCMDYWVTAGDTPAEILESYAEATGTVPLAPDYAIGFWQCKMRYRTQEELLEAARGYKKRGLPISVIVIDYFHWPLQGDWKFDSRYWPDPKAMIAELKEMGIETVVSVWPTVDKQSASYHEMLEKGYLVQSERGVRFNMDWAGNVTFYDATHPGARDYLWQKVKENYYRFGIKTFWLDAAEPEFVIYDFDHYRYNAGTALQMTNIYPLLYAKTIYDGLKKEGEDKIISLIRCAWAGSQRYGALVWSGDILSTFESLRNQVAAGLNMGLAGIPWWTTDIGGFHAGNAADPRFHELLIRWLEWGCFCPVMRMHGVRDPITRDMEGPHMESGAPTEIWAYTGEVYEIGKKFLFLREYLRPYIAGLMKEAHEKGYPVIRPLFFDFPADENTWEVEDEFMFGPNYLVAPVLYEGMRERKLYLPAGQNWTNAWTGEQCKGGAVITAAAPLDQIPVFTRDGSDFRGKPGKA